MPNKISFYFEKIQDLANSDKLDELIDIHTKSFEHYGWEVVRLDESVARSHPLYEQFNDPESILGSSRNGWEYTRSCYMRWLAYAMAGHYFADFDVVNYGFTSKTADDLRAIAGGPAFVAGATAMGLFRGEEYDQILHAFLRYKENPFVEGILEQDVNDMTILIQTRPDLFSLISRDDTRIVRDYNNPGWEVAKAVHYPYAYTPQPRSNTVLRVRPLAFLETERPSKAADVAEAWPSYMAREDVVNAALSLFPKPNYLEIGVNTGKTFFAAMAHSKVAVDPVFLFDIEQAKRQNPNAIFYSVESDPYFGGIASDRDAFDVIYLDGMHTFEQTLRDFCNAVTFLKPDGIIIIDDVVPSSYHAAIPDHETAYYVRKELGVEDGMWMGDVYRLVLFIQSFFQQFQYATVTENHGQLVVWRQKRESADVVRRQVEDVARAPFDTVLLQPEAFNRMPFGEIMARLRNR